MKKVRDTYVEEVEHLKSFGTSIDDILAALNISAATLARALYREGRPDLARPFGALAKRLRTQRAAS